MATAFIAGGNLLPYGGLCDNGLGRMTALNSINWPGVRFPLKDQGISATLNGTPLGDGMICEGWMLGFLIFNGAIFLVPW